MALFKTISDIEAWAAQKELPDKEKEFVSALQKTSNEHIRWLINLNLLDHFDVSTLGMFLRDDKEAFDMLLREAEEKYGWEFSQTLRELYGLAEQAGCINLHAKLEQEIVRRFKTE